MIGQQPKPIFDPQALEKLQVLNQPGQPDIVAELITDFLSYLPTRVSDLQRAVATGASADVVRLSHSLKSASGVLGLQALESTCREIEMNPFKGNSHLDTLRDQVNAAQSALKRHLQS